MKTPTPLLLSLSLSIGLMAIPYPVLADAPAAPVPHTAGEVAETAAPMAGDTPTAAPAESLAQVQTELSQQREGLPMATEIIRIALLSLVNDVSAYDTAVTDMEQADTTYRTNYSEYNRMKMVAAGRTDPTITLPYPQVIQARDDAFGNAKASLRDLRTSAVQATTLYARLIANAALPYGYSVARYSTARGDLPLLAGDLIKTHQVFADLPYLEAHTNLLPTTPGAPLPDALPAARKELAVAQGEIATSTRLKTWAVAYLNDIVNDYNNQLQGIEAAANRYVSLSKSQSRLTQAERTAQQNASRNRRNRGLQVAATNARNALNNCVQGMATSKSSIASMAATARAEYATLLQYPLLFGDVYKDGAQVWAGKTAPAVPGLSQMFDIPKLKYLVRQKTTGYGG